MPYKNIKDVMVDATKIPAAIEAALPAGIPKLSTSLVNVAASMPTLPDFPMAIPDIPAVPALPAFALPSLGAVVGKEAAPAPAPRRAAAFAFK